MSHILFVLTSHDKKGSTGEPTGFYLPEVTHPHKVLIDAGHAVSFVSPKGGKAPMDGVDLNDAVNKAFLENTEYRKQIENTLRPEQVKAADYDAMYYAGGHGTMWDFADNAELAKIAAQIYEAGGIVGAVCHGPVGLVNVKLSNGKYLVEGKQLSAFTDDEERAVGLDKVVPFLLASTLVERGAKHKPAANWQKQVVTDGRLVTGQNPASALGVGEAMAALLASKA